MFFTITSVDNIILDLDEFLVAEPELFNSVFEVVSAYNLIGVSGYIDNRHAGLVQDRFRVVTPATATEAVLFQNVLRRALAGLQAKPSKTVYVAAGGRHVKKACELLLGTALVRRPGISTAEMTRVYQTFPDFVVPGPAELKDALIGSLAGYGGEHVSTPTDARMICSPAASVCYMEVSGTEHADCPMIIAGRYFGDKDPRHDLHALSIRLVGAKNKPESQAKIFAEILADGVEVSEQNTCDLIGCVPPRSGKPNRGAAYMKEMALINGGVLKDVLRPDLLKCIRDYPVLKTLPASRRREAVRGAFALTEDVKGKTVVIVDDIRTTGSTIDETICVLKDGGAKTIVPIVIGYHPFANTMLALSDEEDLHCALCQGKLVPRTRGSDGEPFYGCSGWSRGNNSHTTRSLISSVREKLEKIEPKLMAIDDELNADRIDF